MWKQFLSILIPGTTRHHVIKGLLWPFGKHRPTRPSAWAGGSLLMGAGPWRTLTSQALPNCQRSPRALAHFTASQWNAPVWFLLCPLDLSQVRTVSVTATPHGNSRPAISQPPAPQLFSPLYCSRTEQQTPQQLPNTAIHDCQGDLQDDSKAKTNPGPLVPGQVWLIFEDLEYWIGISI